MALIKTILEWLEKYAPRFVAHIFLFLVAVGALYFAALTLLWETSERRAIVLSHLQYVYSLFSPRVLVSVDPVPPPPPTVTPPVTSAQNVVPGSGQFRVYVQYAASRPDLRSKAQDIYSLLLRQRFENLRVFAPDPQTSPRGNLVVYYYDEDKAAAEFLAANLNANLGISGPRFDTLLGRGGPLPPQRYMTIWITG